MDLLPVAKAIFAVFAAMLSKEQGITAIVIIACADIAFTVVRSVEAFRADVKPSIPKSTSTSSSEMPASSSSPLDPSIVPWNIFDVIVGEPRLPARGSVRPRPTSAPSVLKHLLSALRTRLVALSIAGAIMFAMRLAMLHGQQPIFNPLEIPAAFEDSFLTRTLTFNYLAVFNAYLLAVPATLSMDWSHGSIPLLQSLGDSRVLTIAVFYVALAACAVYVCAPLLIRTWSSSFQTGIDSLILILFLVLTM